MIKKKRIIRISFSKTHENNSKYFNSFTTIYDTSGRIIYEDKTQGFTRWHCYSYKYDANDHLVYKEGYSSGEMGIKKTYIYKGELLIKEITERAGGKVEKSYTY